MIGWTFIKCWGKWKIIWPGPNRCAYVLKFLSRHYLVINIRKNKIKVDTTQYTYDYIYVRCHIRHDVSFCHHKMKETFSNLPYLLQYLFYEPAHTREHIVVVSKASVMVQVCFSYMAVLLSKNKRFTTIHIFFVTKCHNMRFSGTKVPYLVENL